MYSSMMIPINGTFILPSFETGHHPDEFNQFIKEMNFFSQLWRRSKYPLFRNTYLHNFYQIIYGTYVDLGGWLWDQIQMIK